MKRMTENDRFIVAITGAQGVGKSTFCAKLLTALDTAGLGSFRLIDDLRNRLELTGVPFGSGSTPETIHAVWVVHLERQVVSGNERTLLDRCVVDALAYTRVLAVSSDLEQRLFEQIGRLALSRLNLIIHLRLSDFFADKGKPHETPQHRHLVAKEIALILDGWHGAVLTLDADNPSAVERAVAAVRAALISDAR